MIDKIMVITVTDDRNYPDYFWRDLLKKNCKQLVWINLQSLYFNKGCSKSIKYLLNRIKLDKPDYLFMFDSLYYDLDLPSFILASKKLSPRTKSILFSGDDDLLFDSIRYLGLFFDYLFIAQNDFLEKYRKDGLNNTHFITQIPLIENTFDKKKKIEVSFVGTPKADRKEIVEYLNKNRVNISVYGPESWKKFPELKGVYKGFLSPKDYFKTVNQTKINICLSKNMLNQPHMKGRFMEISLFKAFSLVEYSPQLAKLFLEGKEIIFFKNKEDLLSKIYFYLNNDNQREKIALASYKRVKKDYNFEKIVSKFLENNKHKSTKLFMKRIPSKIYEMKKSDFLLSKKELLEKIKYFDYISLKNRKSLQHPLKNILQIYSIEKNNKPISCCDYFIYSKLLGNISRFRFSPFGVNSNKDLAPFLDINQLMIKKDFIIKNFEEIRKAYFSDKLTFVKRENTTFISIPLVKISKFRKGFFKNYEFSNELGFFLHSFHRELYSKRKNPINFLIYAFGLIIEGIFGKRFIFSIAKKKLKDKNINSN